jgi:hypothetical protein
MRRLMLLALVALFGLLVFLAVDALAVPVPLFAKVVPTPLFARVVPTPIFACVDVPVVAVVKPRTPVRTAVKAATRLVARRICGPTGCRVEWVEVPCESAKPAGDAKPADAAPASVGAGSGCAGGVCRPALRLGILRRR